MQLLRVLIISSLYCMLPLGLAAVITLVFYGAQIKTALTKYFG